MTDKKGRDGEPVLDVRWDTPVLSVNKKYSTTIRIQAVGWWPEGRPKQVNVSFYQIGKKSELGTPVRMQRGHGIFPVIGLWPGYHYHVVVRVGDIGERLPVEMTMIVPELPKKPTADEKKTVALKAKTELAKAEKGLKDAQQALQAEPPRQKRQVKILHAYKQPSRLEVVLQRTGKDGRPEVGEISVLDFEQGGVVFGNVTGDFSVQEKKWGIVVVFLPYFEYPREVTFFLPDDPDVKATVDIPARFVKEEKKSKSTARPSLFQKMREAYVQERSKVKAPPFELKIQRRQPLIFLTDLPLREQD